MSLYVYFNESQQHEGAIVLKVFPESIRLNRFEKLESIGETDVLVLLSQPSDVYAMELNEAYFAKVIVHEGIRFEAPNSIYAGDIEEVVKFVKKELEGIIKHNQVKYLNQVHERLNLSKDEADYLDAISNEKTKRKWIGFKKLKAQKTFTPFAPGMVAIMGPSKSVSDFAKVMAIGSNQKILLIDGNLLNPSMDIHFKINHLGTSIKSHLKGIDNTGFNIAMDAVSKDIPFHEILPQIVKKVEPKLDLLLGNYNLYNYEHYDLTTLKAMIETLKEQYSSVLVHVSATPYDAFTLLGLHLSKLNLMICEDNPLSLRYMHNVMEILQAKQQIPKQKFLTVLDAGNKKIPYLGGGVMKEVFDENYLGSIYGGKRNRARCLKQVRNAVLERHGLWD